MAPNRVKVPPQACSCYPLSRTEGKTDTTEGAGCALYLCPSENHRFRLWAASLVLLSSIAFFAALEASCQTNSGTLLSIQCPPGTGYWVAGYSSLQALTPINDIRLAA